MARPRIIIDTLARMVEYGYYYYAMCHRCRHCVELDMALLIERLGPDYPAAGNDLGQRLRCRECGHRGANSFVGNEAARRASGGKRSGPGIEGGEDGP